MCRAGVSGGYQFVQLKVVNKYTWLRMAEGRVVDRALMDCLVTKMNAWKTVRCVSVER